MVRLNARPLKNASPVKSEYPTVLGLDRKGVRTKRSPLTYLFSLMSPITRSVAVITTHSPNADSIARIG